MKLKEGTKFYIDVLKKKYDISFLDGKIYEFVTEDSAYNQIWKVDGELVRLDRYDAMFGFPFYLRQILMYETEKGHITE